MTSHLEARASPESFIDHNGSEVLATEAFDERGIEHMEIGFDAGTLHNHILRNPANEILRQTSRR